MCSSDLEREARNSYCVKKFEIECVAHAPAGEGARAPSINRLVPYRTTFGQSRSNHDDMLYFNAEGVVNMQNAKEIYQNTVSHLPSEERLQLAALILSDLVRTKPNGESNLSIVEFIRSLPAGRGFHTSAEADEFLRQERDSWDR